MSKLTLKQKYKMIKKADAELNRLSELLVDYKKIPANSGVESLYEIVEHIRDEFIDEVMQVDDYGKYCGKFRVDNYFAADKVFEVVYYGEGFKSVLKQLKSIKDEVVLEKNKRGKKDLGQLE